MTMKHNWEYKTLGSACIPKKEILRASLKFGKEDTIEYIDISSIHKDSGTVNPTTYTFMDAPSRAQQVVNDNDVLVSLVRPNLKNIALIQDDKDNLVASSGFCVLRGKTLSQRYIYHLVNSKYFTNKLVIKCAGAAYPAVREQDVKDTIVPVPPMAVQERIVAELDKINEVIADCRELLRNLDALAQSLFYDTFGDPISNPMGWEIFAWSEVLKIINGKNQKAVENPNGKYPIYGSGGIMSYADSYLCPENCTIIGRKGNISKPIFVKTKFWNVDTAFGLSPNADKLSPIYFFFFCKNYDFERHNKAVTIPSLIKADLLKIKIPVPPLALQEQFAARIEEIEAQKRQVEATIAEMQTLLDSRMDYWFN